jgi:tRNA(Arg) A34 adenosine deaminase TadA
MGATVLHLQMPDWLEAHSAGELVLPELVERMAYVIDLSLMNIEHGGGPFGAAVFERDTGRLVAPGVNLVMAQKQSTLHAEVVAIMAAQRRFGVFDLGDAGLPACELVASTEPCVMCYGAIHWSGVKRLVCGARDEDARAIGFDEGHKADDWVEGLTRRGVEVVRDLRRNEARSVLEEYLRRGGEIYNARGA